MQRERKIIIITEQEEEGKEKKAGAKEKIWKLGRERKEKRRKLQTDGSSEIDLADGVEEGIRD